jgi:alpha-L-fucosidase/lysophospholipase L1-like esterase
MRSVVRSSGVLALMVFFIAALTSAERVERPIKVACIGNSITYGDGVRDPARNSYPAQLQRILGDGWQVRNFGLGGRTLLRKGDFPYWIEKELVEVKAFNPDVVVIKLGTNDSKPQNWVHRDEFISNYEQFIQQFQKLPSSPRVFICTPVPAFPGDWGIRDSVIRDEICPMIRTLGASMRVPIIDLYAALNGKGECFPDKVHPNEDGARLIAEAVSKEICRECRVATVPAPYGPLPAGRQLRWQDLEYYAFIHFNMNTFTNREWGEGNEDPNLFNPAELDCRQWARVCKEAGMKGIIITAKHHDGFCLWPSKLTEHSVRNSPFRGGKGDVLKELSDACRDYGLRFGVYVSPWDRHEPSYGDSPRYNEHFRNQLREVLTSYGNVFEVWFDGACGEGPNGKRQVYDWPAYVSVVRECQPDAVIFSDAGPDVRWVGDEDGIAGETNWSLLRRDEVYPGYEKYHELTSGHPDGAYWVPAECDVSIRPGWFFHQSQNEQVKTGKELLALYFASVGRNASLLLNIPVDRRGLIHENDVHRLMEFKMLRDSAFTHDLAKGARAVASQIRGSDRRFDAQAAVDDRSDTYWATDDSVTEASLTVELGSPVEINCILMQEYIPLGQRVQRFSVDILEGGSWRQVASGTTIGNKRILKVPAVNTAAVRLNILRSRACPTISRLALYRVPDLDMDPPGN